MFGHLSGVRPLRKAKAWDRLLRQDGRGELEGVLALQSDFWITPAFLTRRYDPKKIWILDHLSRICVPANRFHGYNVTRWRMRIQEAKEELKHAGLEVNVTCVLWSDAYYLPRGVWPLYQDAVAIIGKHGLPNDICIPLGLQVARRSGCAGTDCEAELIEGCFGHCCIQSRSPDDMLTFPCGHKFDMRDPSFRKTLSSLWQH